MAKTYRAKGEDLKIVVTKEEGGVEYGKLVGPKGEGPESPVQSILWMMPYTDFEAEGVTPPKVPESPLKNRSSH